MVLKREGLGALALAFCVFGSALPGGVGPAHAATVSAPAAGLCTSVPATRGTTSPATLVTPTPSVLPTPGPGALHPGDKVTVTVFDHPELSGDVTVANDGSIVVPLGGRVVTSGDVRSVAFAIEAKLAAYLLNPAVDVKLVSQSNSAFLAGNASGTIALKPGDRLVTALTDVKLASTADLTRVTILRNGVVGPPNDVIQLRAAANAGPLLASGDIINVPSKPVTVAVSGAVKLPATVYLDTGEPLADALAQVQTTDDADLGYIWLTRGTVVCYSALGGAIMATPAQPGDQLMIGRPAHVTVGGQVAKAGPVLLKGDHSLVNAVTLAGGPSKEGNLNKVIVMRAGSPNPGVPYDITRLSSGDPSANPELFEGDSVFVTQAKQHLDPRAIFAAILLAAKKYVKLPK
jgi:protein involved in polysaccharide export with SLBB domain